MLLNFLPFYSDDDGQPEGGSDVRASDVLQRFGNTAESALRLAEKLAEAENANYKLREKNRTLRQERDDARGKVPAEGAVVVPQEDAALLETYRAFGAPALLQTALDTKSTAEQELSTLKREKTERRAAEIAGFEPVVLSTLAKDLDIQIKGTPDKPLPVVLADGQETALEDYARAHWTKFDASLRVHGSSQAAPDINAGARGNGTAPLITDEERLAAARRYSATF